MTLARWPGADCSPEFCMVALERHGRRLTLLLSRNREYVEPRGLLAACERADVVVSDRRLPWYCRPRRLKADRALLARTGGLAFDLRSGRVTSVAESQGEHGWWRPSRRGFEIPPRGSSAARQDERGLGKTPLILRRD